MGMKKSYLAMKTEAAVASDLIDSDLKEIGIATKKLANHVVMLGGLGFGTSFLKWIASFAAMYVISLFPLLVDLGSNKLEEQHAYSPPNSLHFLESPFITLWFVQGRWLSLIAVITRLFFPRHFPDWLEAPAALVLLMVVAPSLFADTVRNSWIGTLICLVIGCYLLQEHIRASGGFRNSFTKANGISNTIGIILLLVYPVWALILHFL